MLSHYYATVAAPMTPMVDLCYMIDHDERQHVYPPNSGTFFPEYGTVRTVPHLVHSKRWRKGTTPAQVFSILYNIMKLFPIAVRIVRTSNAGSDFHILFAISYDAHQCVILNNSYQQTVNAYGHVYTRPQTLQVGNATISFEILTSPNLQ